MIFNLKESLFCFIERFLYINTPCTNIIPQGKVYYWKGRKIVVLGRACTSRLSPTSWKTAFHPESQNILTKFSHFLLYPSRFWKLLRRKIKNYKLRNSSDVIDTNYIFNVPNNCAVIIYFHLPLHKFSKHWPS